MGVRWEGHLIYQHLYNAGARNEKFIPILYTYSSAAQIPVPLQSATYYFADKDEDYEKLYRCLRGVKAKGKPDLGPLRPLPEQERRTDVGMFVTGFIDLDLWNKAKWQGTVYLHDAQGLEPPWLALLFTESEPAEAIFEQWHKRLGRSDSYNELRISIIEGDIPGEENGYSVHVSANIENIFKRADDQGIDLPQPYVMMVSRLNRMNPAPDSQNLAMFKERFRRFGCYYLIPAAMTPEGVVTFTKHRILKRNVEFRSTAEIISKNDPDSAVLPQFRSRENE